MLVVQGSQMARRDINVAPQIKSFLSDAGFVDVTEKVYKLPQNTWPKDLRLKQIGRFQAANMRDAIEAISLMLFTKVLGWSRDEMDALLASVRKDLNNRKIHAYYNVHVITARKPRVKEQKSVAK
jgi:hypothetical protein